MGYTARGRRKRLERVWSRSWSIATIESASNARRNISLAMKRAGEPSTGIGMLGSTWRGLETESVN